MQWIIAQGTGNSFFWKEAKPHEGIGAAGEWVAGVKSATVYTDDQRLAYIAEKGELPADFRWKCMTRRFKNAIDIQSAVNPAGIALALHEAFCEVNAEDGDTKAQKTDPACRLIAYQLCWLLYGGVEDYTQYSADYQACSAQVAASEDSK